MSQESLDAFYTEVGKSPELREKLLVARAEATARVAAEAGFDITIEEARDDCMDPYNELTDERLEAVAGGLLQIPFAQRGDVPE